MNKKEIIDKIRLPSGSEFITIDSAADYIVGFMIAEQDKYQSLVDAAVEFDKQSMANDGHVEIVVMNRFKAAVRSVKPLLLSEKLDKLAIYPPKTGEGESQWISIDELHQLAAEARELEK